MSIIGKVTRAVKQYIKHGREQFPKFKLAVGYTSRDGEKRFLSYNGAVEVFTNPIGAHVVADRMNELGIKPPSEAVTAWGVYDFK